MNQFIDSESSFRTKDWESTNVADILQHARELWPEIKDEEIEICGSGNSEYTGDDANYYIKVQPSPEYKQRNNM
jgi:hypothetical protein